MKPARSIDITAKTSNELRERFDIKITGENVLFWTKSAQAEEAAAGRNADITLPKFLFRPEVLKELEQNFSA